MGVEKKLSEITGRTSTNDSLIHHVVGGQSGWETKGNFIGNRVDSLEENQYSGVIVYQTLADLPATGVVNTSYKVANDSTSSNNGYYSWTGSAYVKDANLANGEVTSGNTEAVEGGKIYTEFDHIKKTDIKQIWFRGDLTISDGYWKCSNAYLYAYTRNGSTVNRNLPETEFATVANNEAIVYKISAGVSNPQKVAISAIDYEDDIVLNAYDAVSKWHSGELHKRHQQNQIDTIEVSLDDRIGVKIDAGFYRGIITIDGDDITLGAGSYYFIHPTGDKIVETLASDTTWTLDGTSGRHLVLRKTSDTSGVIEQKLEANIDSSNMVTIAYYDPVHGMSGILYDEYLRNKTEFADFEPKNNFTSFFWASDTHVDDVSSLGAGSTKNIYGNFTRQYEDLGTIIAKANCEFYIHTGDLIETPIDVDETRALSALASAKRVDDRLPCPQYKVAGNHDVDYGTWTELDMVTFYQNVRDTYIEDVQASNYSESEKLGYYHTTRGNLHIIVLNTNDKDALRTGAYYDIDATQQSWFDTELNTIPNGSHILIASHITLNFESTGFGGADINDVTIQSSTITAMETVMETYLTNNTSSRIIAWIGGHAHENNHKQVAITTSGGQTELNYVTMTRTGYSQQDPIYNRSNLAFATCVYDVVNKKLNINGYGRQDSYEFDY